MSYDPKRCRACNGTGEIYTPWDPYDDDPWTECGDCDGYGIEISARSRRHYLAIAEEAARVGWPAHYRRDLTLHDRDILADRDPSLPFAWILCECGTHIVLPVHAREAWKPGADVGATVLRTLGANPDHLIYWWNGWNLRRVDLARCLKLYLDECGITEEEEDAVYA